MLEDDIQRELLCDTIEVERAISIAVNMEVGHQNQQQISSLNTSDVNINEQLNRLRGANARPQQRGRNSINGDSNGLCSNYRQKWTPSHRQVCIATGNKCNHCGILNHFAEVCRKKHKQEYITKSSSE